MKDAIEFIKHAVVNRQYDEQLSQIHACGDYIQSFNGIVTMSHNLNGIGSFSVNSTKLLNAIKLCEWEPEIKVTDKNVILKKDRIRAQLPCSRTFEKRSMISDPASINYVIKEPIIPAIKRLFPFVSDDASRVWSQSIMVRGKWAYVTNNIIVARTKVKLPECTIPLPALHVLLKVGEEPTSILYNNRQMAFIYGTDKWINTRLIAEQWPDIKIIFKNVSYKKVKQFNKRFIHNMDALGSFVEDDIVLVRDKVLQTNEGDFKIKDVELPNLAFSHIAMKKILTTFTHCDFNAYPEIMPLMGDKIEGGFMGMII